MGTGKHLEIYILAKKVENPHKIEIQQSVEAQTILIDHSNPD